MPEPLGDTHLAGSRGEILFFSLFLFPSYLPSFLPKSCEKTEGFLPLKEEIIE